MVEVQAGLAAWLAFLIVGVALLLIAGILAGSGICLSKSQAPERTIAQANLATAEISDAAQRALAAANAPQIEGQVVPPTKAIT